MKHLRRFNESNEYDIDFDVDFQNIADLCNTYKYDGEDSIEFFYDEPDQNIFTEKEIKNYSESLKNKSAIIDELLFCLQRYGDNDYHINTKFKNGSIVLSLVKVGITLELNDCINIDTNDTEFGIDEVKFKIYLKNKGLILRRIGCEEETDRAGDVYNELTIYFDNTSLHDTNLIEKLSNDIKEIIDYAGIKVKSSSHYIEIISYDYILFSE